MWLAKQSHSNECFFYAGSCRVFCGIFGPLSSGWTEGNMPPLLWPPSQISSSKDWIPVKKKWYWSCKNKQTWTVWKFQSWWNKQITLQQTAQAFTTNCTWKHSWQFNTELRFTGRIKQVLQLVDCHKNS